MRNHLTQIIQNMPLQILELFYQVPIPLIYFNVIGWEHHWLGPSQVPRQLLSVTVFY